MKRSELMNSETWFNKWLKLMGSSASFRHLLEECVLPILRKQTLLAFPEDARLRDKFACVFSLEVLHSIEGAEGPLQSFFESERVKNMNSSSSHLAAGEESNYRDVEISVIMTVLRRINLVPTVINEPQVAQLIRDVMPEDISKRRGIHSRGHSIDMSNSEASNALMGGTINKPFLLFPQWEWVLSVVAYQAVETAIAQSTIFTNPNKIPSLVAGVITSIASAITQYQ